MVKADDATLELPIYKGMSDHCRSCEGPFADGQIISVDEDGHTYCYSDASGVCVQRAVIKHGKTIRANPQVFKKS
ncbi:MAG: hypothetical protein V1763_02955 [Parcubacteria group bacterium]